MFRVTLDDQTTYDAKVIGFDQYKNVEVLQINAPKDKLKPIQVSVFADVDHRIVLVDSFINFLV